MPRLGPDFQELKFETLILGKHVRLFSKWNSIHLLRTPPTKLLEKAESQALNFSFACRNKQINKSFLTSQLKFDNGSILALEDQIQPIPHISEKRCSSAYWLPLCAGSPLSSTLGCSMPPHPPLGDGDHTLTLCMDCHYHWCEIPTIYFIYNASSYI